MKIPFPTSIENRNSSVAKDAKIVNGIVQLENDTEGVEKRPAIDQAYQTVSTAAGQGFFVASGPTSTSDYEVAIVGDVMWFGLTKTAKNLVWGVQPPDWKILTALSPAPQVLAVDKWGNTVTSFTGAVSVGLDYNPSSGTLTGTTSSAAVAGVATFSNLKLGKVAQYSLRASASGMRAKTSNRFNIRSKLAFTTEPTTKAPDATMTVRVGAVDGDGNVITAFTGSITISLITNPGGSTITGTTTVAAVSGEATFNISLDQEADGYELGATADDSSYGLADTSSSIFNITSALTLTAGSAEGTFFGYDAGYPFGSLNPATYNDATINYFYTYTTDSLTRIRLTSTVAQNFFTSITLDSETPLLSADATFQQAGGSSIWTWPGVTLMTTTGTFSVVIV